MKKVIFTLTFIFTFISCVKEEIYYVNCDEYHNPNGCYIVQDFHIDECAGDTYYVIEARRGSRYYDIWVTYQTWLDAYTGDQICF